MKRCVLALALVLLVNLGTSVTSPTAGSGLSADMALQRLQEGNSRFVSGHSEHPNLDAARRSETTLKGQRPPAVVLTCSDSRVPPELLFDQGIGDLFVVRVAGNVCGIDEIGSIEYSVEHLSASVVIVLGHSHCGAVAAATEGGELPGSISAIVEKIRPVVAKVRREHPALTGKKLIAAAENANIWQSIDDLVAKSLIVRHACTSGALHIMAAKYDTATGRVEWLGERKVESKK